MRWTCKSPAREFFGRVKKSGFSEFLNIISSTASLYRLALSVQRCTLSTDQYNTAAKCILSIYSQPFRCHLLTYCRTLSSLIERPVRKHHILSIYCEVGGGKIIIHIMPIYVSYSHSGIDYQRLLLASNPHNTHRLH